MRTRERKLLVIPRRIFWQKGAEGDKVVDELELQSVAWEQLG